jgi:hypothetical protein
MTEDDYVEADGYLGAVMAGVSSGRPSVLAAASHSLRTRLKFEPHAKRG